MSGDFHGSSSSTAVEQRGVVSAPLPRTWLSHSPDRVGRGCSLWVSPGKMWASWSSSTKGGKRPCAKFFSRAGRGSSLPCSLPRCLKLTGFRRPELQASPLEGLAAIDESFSQACIPCWCCWSLRSATGSFITVDVNGVSTRHLKDMPYKSSEAYRSVGPHLTGVDHTKPQIQ